MPNMVRPHPKGICFKTCVYREGPYMHAITTMVHNGDVEVFKASVDLRPIEAAVRRYHQKLHAKNGGVHVGWFGSSIAHAVSHAVSSIGHAGIVKSIANNVKSVVKSKVTGGIIAATAVVFPPVGLPAAAAYATANAALTVLDNAKSVENRVTQIATSGSNAAKAAAQAQIPKIKELMQKKAAVQGFLQRTLTAAKHGDKGAQFTARVFNIVQAQRNALQNKIGNKPLPPGSIPALLIDERGRIVKGHFLDKHANNTLKRVTLFKGGKLQHGNFQQVAGMGGQVSNPMQLPPWAR